MSDIVGRLRKPEFYFEPGTPPDEMLLALVRGMEALCRSAAKEIEQLRLERVAAEDVARTARILSASALEPFADVYSGGEGFEGYHGGEQVYLTCGRVKHYALTLECFKRAAIAFMSLSGDRGGK